MRRPVGLAMRAARLVLAALLGSTLALAAAHASPETLAAALAPHGWMAAQPSWPCRYSGGFRQTRFLGTRELDSRGRFFQDCERGLLWRVEAPRSDVSVYAKGGNFLRLQRGSRSALRVSLIDGLAERRIGALLGDLFGGDVAALDRDFSHRVQADGSVRLMPRDARLAMRLEAIELTGDVGSTALQVLAPGSDGAGALLRMTLEDFALAADDGACAETFAGDDAGLEGCDALHYPARWLQRARDVTR